MLSWHVLQSPAYGKDKSESAWESLQKHDTPQWLRDGKFGIYTHWGPVTVGAEDGPGGVQWYGRNMYKQDSPAFEYHRQKYGEQSVGQIAPDGLTP